MWTEPLAVRVPVTLTCCPSWPETAEGLSMGTTFWSLSVTSTGFSPPSRHFLAHCAWAALAPLAAHLESLIHPSQLLVAGLAIAHAVNNINPIAAKAIFFIEHLFLTLSANLREYQCQQLWIRLGGPGMQSYCRPREMALRSVMESSVCATIRALKASYFLAESAE